MVNLLADMRIEYNEFYCDRVGFVAVVPLYGGHILPNGSPPSCCVAMAVYVGHIPVWSMVLMVTYSSFLEA